MVKYPDFSLYSEDLDIDSLAEQGIDALKAELKQMRELYKSMNDIFEDSLDGFFVTDGIGNVIKVNKSYEIMSGIKQEEILGKNMVEFEGHLISKSASLITLKTGKPATIEQTYLRTKRKAYITSTPIFDEDGHIVMVVSNNRDFKMIEELRNELINQKEQVSVYKEKMKALAMQNMDRGLLLVNDPKMYDVLYMATKVADKDTTVLIEGETGTGKEMMANYIHQNSTRKDNLLLSLNCGAIAKDLIESELFGYEGGAFTGALSKGKSGYFEVANGGTLFLDEIGELPLDVQMKLLRVLQENEVLRIGSTKPRKIDVRVIAATNRDLLQMVRNNEFRQDLYYRLNIITLKIPPLRERKQDIIPMAEHFLKVFNDKFKTNKILSDYSYKMLLEYKWPGNVRELKNTIEKMVILSDDNTISAPELLEQETKLMKENVSMGPIHLKEILEQIELRYLNEYYAKYKTLEQTSQYLGMNMKTLSRRKRELEKKYQ